MKEQAPQPNFQRDQLHNNILNLHPLFFVEPEMVLIINMIFLITVDLRDWYSGLISIKSVRDTTCTMNGWSPSEFTRWVDEKTTFNWT